MTTVDADRLANAREQAFAQLESIKEMVAALEAARESDDDKAADEAVQVIHEDALSAEVRSGWQVPGRDKLEAEEYRILLCTGGPAVQITGQLGAFGEPETAELECQDWFTPWTRVPVDAEGTEAMLTYARQFYFGE